MELFKDAVGQGAIAKNMGTIKQSQVICSGITGPVPSGYQDSAIPKP